MPVFDDSTSVEGARRMLDASVLFTTTATGSVGGRVFLYPRREPGVPCLFENDMEECIGKGGYLSRTLGHHLNDQLVDC